MNAETFYKDALDMATRNETGLGSVLELLALMRAQTIAIEELAAQLPAEVSKPIRAKIEETKAALLEKMLHKIEDTNPAAAARLDKRPE